MHVLVTIAHYGSKNRSFLDRMLDTFREMTFEVDVVVLSEAPKDLPDDVQIRVGLPTDDPWSLPFAHRQVFQERLFDYDLFVYSEDDTLIEQRHLEAFLEVSAILPEDHLPGSMRYELDEQGARSYCSFHSHYRWDPKSAFVMGGHAFARFTNDHAAWYAVTQDQLKRAISSGGFLVPPHAGDYDMLVSAATDIFTRCGFTRVISLDRVDDFLVHHLPNVYLGQFGIDETSFRAQVDAMQAIATGDLASDQLVIPETALDPAWNRHAFTLVPSEIDELVPTRNARVLSVGAAAGLPEAALARAGHQVTTVPVDEVFAAVQRERGLEALGPDVDLGEVLASRDPYDHVLLLDLLPFMPDPIHLLRAIRPALRAGGDLRGTVPDMRRYNLRNHLLRRTRARALPQRSQEGGLHWTDARIVRVWLRRAEISLERIEHRSARRDEPFGVGGLRGRLWGNSLFFAARPPRSRG